MPPCSVRREKQHPATDSHLQQDGRPVVQVLYKCHHHVVPPDHRSAGTSEPGQCVLDYEREGGNMEPWKVFLILAHVSPSPHHLCLIQKVYLKNYFHYQLLELSSVQGGEQKILYGNRSEPVNKILLLDRGLLLVTLIPLSSSITTAWLVFRNTQLSLGEIFKAGHKPGRRMPWVYGSPYRPGESFWGLSRPDEQ